MRTSKLSPVAVGDEVNGALDRTFKVFLYAYDKRRARDPSDPEKSLTEDDLFFFGLACEHPTDVELQSCDCGSDDCRFYVVGVFPPKCMPGEAGDTFPPYLEHAHEIKRLVVLAQAADLVSKSVGVSKLVSLAKRAAAQGGDGLFSKN